MKLCFDATRFGCGLDGAIDLAAQKNISCLEYSFLPFAVDAKGKGKAKASQDDKEQEYFASVFDKAQEQGVDFAMLNLDYTLDPLDKKSVKQFQGMMQKLIGVAAALGCPRLGFFVRPDADEEWITQFAGVYALLQETAGQVKNAPEFVLRLASPVEYRGVSLRKWRQLEPQEWRDLLSQCDGLSFSYSPADCLWLGIDYLQNLGSFAQAVAHVVAYDVEINRTLLNDSGMFGPLWWRYRLAGKGQVDWRQVIELLKLYDFHGAFSVQLEDEFLNPDDEGLLYDSLDEGVKYFAPLMRG